MKKNIIISICITSILFIFIGCSIKNNGNIQEEIKDIEVKGKILEVKENDKSILVDSKEDATISGQIWITITEKTSFSEDIPEDRKSFEVDNYVEIIMDGPIMESYPMQGKAGVITVNEKQLQ